LRLGFLDAPFQVANRVQVLSQLGAIARPQFLLERDTS